MRKENKQIKKNWLVVVKAAAGLFWLKKFVLLFSCQWACKVVWLFLDVCSLLPLRRRFTTLVVVSTARWRRFVLSCAACFFLERDERFYSGIAAECSSAGDSSLPIGRGSQLGGCVLRGTEDLCTSGLRAGSTDKTRWTSKLLNKVVELYESLAIMVGKTTVDQLFNGA